MSEATVSAVTACQTTPPKYGRVFVRKGGPGRPAKNPTPVSREAQRCAATILEVLAGVRTPLEAAASLGIALSRYYLWEQRALEGLVRACEPRPVGKAAAERHRIAALEKEVVRLRQDCTRQQALVRASQRTIGLAPLPSPAKPAVKPRSKASAKAGDAVAAKVKRKRRTVARALRAAAALQAAPSQSEVLDNSSSAVATEVVQRIAVEGPSQPTAVAVVSEP